MRLRHYLIMISSSVSLHSRFRASLHLKSAAVEWLMWELLLLRHNVPREAGAVLLNSWNRTLSQVKRSTTDCSYLHIVRGAVLLIEECCRIRFRFVRPSIPCCLCSWRLRERRTADIATAEERVLSQSPLCHAYSISHAHKLATATTRMRTAKEHARERRKNGRCRWEKPRSWFPSTAS